VADRFGSVATANDVDGEGMVCQRSGAGELAERSRGLVDGMALIGRGPGPGEQDLDILEDKPVLVTDWGDCRGPSKPNAAP